MDLIGRNTLAEFLGLTASRISQLTRAGVLERVGRGKYSAPDSIARFIEFKIESAATSDASVDVNEARKKLYDAQVIKTKLETARIVREVIPADEHISDMLELQKIFGAALDSIDGMLADDIAALTDSAAISNRLTAATHAIRESVADNIEAYAQSRSPRPLASRA